MLNLEIVLALLDAYKAERLKDYKKADEYLRMAEEMIAVSDFTDEEMSQITNARS